VQRRGFAWSATICVGVLSTATMRATSAVVRLGLRSAKSMSAGIMFALSCCGACR
jgi:hypothetical protein